MEEKERVEGQEPRLLSKEEVYDYQGETIDVGEKKTSSDAAMEEPEGIFGNLSRKWLVLDCFSGGSAWNNWFGNCSTSWLIYFRDWSDC